MLPIVLVGFILWKRVLGSLSAAPWVLVSGSLDPCQRVIRLFKADWHAWDHTSGGVKVPSRGSKRTHARTHARAHAHLVVVASVHVKHSGPIVRSLTNSGIDNVTALMPSQSFGTDHAWSLVPAAGCPQSIGAYMRACRPTSVTTTCWGMRSAWVSTRVTAPIR
jgi:hypothetical protein